MKKFCILFLTLVMLFNLFATSVAATESDKSGEKLYSSNSLDAVETILGNKEITDNVDTAVIYEMSSNTMLYTINPDQLIEPASLVKIMTCLIAVEQGVMSDAVTIKSESIESIPSDAANVKLQADEVLTLEQFAQLSNIL